MPGSFHAFLRVATALVLLAACGVSQSAPAQRTDRNAPASSSAPTPPQATQAPQPTTAPAAPTAAGQQTAAQPEVRGARTVPRAKVAATVQVQPQLRRGAFSQDRQLQLPEGFSIGLFALIGGARSLALAPWGELLVTQPSQGRIVALRDADGDGTAESQRPLAESLQCPYGMAFQGDYLYVAQSTKVERFKHNGGAGLGPAELVVGGLPQSGCGPHHYRPLVFDVNGYFYVAFGSSCNVCAEGDQRRGTVWQYTPTGGGREFARGLRNVVDLEINPFTGELWGATNERDELGDDIPPDPIDAIHEGANYGWPFCFWTGNHWQVDTRVPPQNPNCAGLSPSYGVQAHSAPLGLTFANQSQFPADLAGSIFSSLHGSWNRSNATGYKLIRVPVVDNQPQPAEDFVTGWLTSQRGPANAWGRPVDVQFGADGALYLSDDQAGAVYRITYSGS